MIKLLLSVLWIPLLFSCKKDFETQRMSLSKQVQDTFEIKMTGHFDGGYQWHFENPESSKHVTLIKDSIIPPRKGIVGGTNTVIFIFVAQSTGRNVLEFKEYRSWEKETSVIGRLLCTVKISK